MPNTDAFEARVTAWANMVRPHTVRFRWQEPYLAEVQREASTPGPLQESARRVLPTVVAQCRYDLRPEDDEPETPLLHRNYQMTNLHDYIETQTRLADEAKERLSDAKRAGARNYDRTKWVQHLGNARQVVEKKHADIVDSMTATPPYDYHPHRAIPVMVVPGQIIVDAETLLGLELDLAEAQYRWHLAEARLAQENLGRGGR